MSRCSILSLTMKKMITMLIMWTFTEMTAAQPLCDPLTQYQRNGECCQMCPPGTSMSSLGTCAEPMCRICDEDEYQDTFTVEANCKRQPYCDPNKNLEFVKEKSKTEKSACACQHGFHCSSDACLTCVPHSSCGPGWGPLVEGNQTHDTVCRRCPEGTFSSKSSWDAVCVRWTECESGYHVGQSGSDKSDVVCEKSQRQHAVIAIIVVLLVVGVALIAAAKIWFSRGRKEESKGKGCVEACVQCDNDPPREEKALLDRQTADAVPEADMPQPSMEEGGTGVPEENEDGPNLAVTGGLLFTDNGNYVTQENGKSEVLSRQESQSGTLLSEKSL
ncbi:tumor necrosis factor receptor superfamily member 5 isoform X2 [Dunckerocampus dactyliophorus]|uniref:tumor necrosis factor receptor superfamily member 5 isoform X2 n=1 Tax=Dunckerocampus dactyliophorus TaxID=161453 RepID=UPI002405B400|nr:tumor necrosis factor receptor superfamily member 5 isoform X2 [Dunckerocampus dactyliophorus]